MSMPDQEDINAILLSASRIVSSAAAQIDNADVHFALHPPQGRALSEDEVQLMLARRKAIVVLRTLRDAAGQVLQATDSSTPLPYGEAVLDPEADEG